MNQIRQPAQTIAAFSRRTGISDPQVDAYVQNHARFQGTGVEGVTSRRRVPAIHVDLGDPGGDQSVLQLFAWSTGRYYLLQDRSQYGSWRGLNYRIPGWVTETETRPPVITAHREQMVPSIRPGGGPYDMRFRQTPSYFRGAMYSNAFGLGMCIPSRPMRTMQERLNQLPDHEPPALPESTESPRDLRTQEVLERDKHEERANQLLEIVLPDMDDRNSKPTALAMLTEGNRS